MALKLTFLGSGSAFTVSPENYHSNVLFEVEGDSLLVDAGTDIRHSLQEQNKSYRDIKNVYITHLHGDHSGGLEWLALTSFFSEEYKAKPTLFISEKLVDDLWNKSLCGGLSTLPSVRASIDNFFNVKSIKQFEGFEWASIRFRLVQTIHFYSEYELMPSYGLIFNYKNTRVLYTSDTQSSPDQLISFYEEADIIFHDCETLDQKSGVHAHYSELVELPAHIKKKMWLYHYNPGQLPDAVKDGFQGFVVKGQVFYFN